jgi:TatD-related deoxyribonuclease
MHCVAEDIYVVIFDNHLHLRRDGYYLDAVKDFKTAGGTHFVLCQYPMPDIVLKEKSYQLVYQVTLDMAKEIKSKVDIGVFVTVGPYPVDYLHLKESLGRNKTIALMKSGIDLAAQLCAEKKCIAIGEIGRPHFPVDDETLVDSNEILEYGMQQAHDVGVPVVLHTESTTPEQCKELVDRGKKEGLPAHMIIKHFAPPLIYPKENYGLVPSVLSSKKNIIEALGKGSRFLMETDYIDDLRRPGAVLGPKTVPKLTKQLISQGVLPEKIASCIHKDLPEKTYGIILEE